MAKFKPDRQYWQKLLKLLKIHYPQASIVLNYTNNFELLAAVVLSAQATDKKVNEVTEKLFNKYKTVKDYARADLKELEQDIKQTGFYKNKARYIKNSAQKIIDKHGGKVPGTMAKLTDLPGVARKSANIILGNGFNKVEGIAVDTHVKRLSQRLGLTEQSNPDKIEKDLMQLFSKKDWFKLTYLLIDHGRSLCMARNPNCQDCFLNKICPSAFKV
jgi:endonuclease III